VKSEKNVLWNIIGTSTDSFSSLFFLLIVSRINGTYYAGIYSFAFALSIIAFCIAKFITRTYQVTDISGVFSDYDYFFTRIFTCIISVISVILFCIIKNYPVYKFSAIIAFTLLKIIESFFESIYAIIQKHNLLYKVGILMTLRSILNVIVFLIADLITKDFLIACAVVIFADLFLLIWLMITVNNNIDIKASSFNIKKVFLILKIGFCTFTITALNLIIVNIPKFVIDKFGNNELQALLGYIIIPASFMNLVSQYIIHPYLLKLTETVKLNNYAQLLTLLKQILSIISIIGVFVMIVAYILETPILSFIFNTDLSPYKSTMMFIIMGSVFYSVESIVSDILIVFRKTFKQSIIYFVSTVFSVCISIFLIKKSLLFGAGISFLITMIFLAVLLLIMLFYYTKQFKKLWNKKGD